MNALKGAGWLLAILLVLLVLLSWGCGGIHNLDQGYRGVVYGQFTKEFSPTGLTEGFNWVAPGFYEIKVYDCRTQAYDMNGAEAIDGLSSDGLKMSFDVTVQYHLSRNIETLNALHQQVGESYFERWVRPDLREGVRAEMAKFTAVDAYSTERDNIKQAIVNRLQAKLEGRGIIVEDVLLRKISIPSSISEAIELKIQRQQDAQAMEFTLQKESQQAEVVRIQAQADADKVLIAAQAEADALNIKGEAIRANPTVLELERIKTFGNTINPNVKVMVVPEGLTTLWGLPLQDAIN